LRGILRKNGDLMP